MRQEDLSRGVKNSIGNYKTRVQEKIRPGWGEIRRY